MLKVAVFYDWLNQWGGAERVLLDILSIYPQADLYTLVHDPQKTKWLPPKTKIITSFINKLPFSKNNPLFYTPFYDIALEQFDLSAYDLVISTTSTIGHCFITPASAKYVCYFHNINRYLYQTPKTFRLLVPLLKLYCIIDKIYSSRPDFLLTNSATVQHRIKNHYCRDSIVVHPGVDTNRFCLSASPTSEYFLVVSRLVDHKLVNIAIEACHRLNQKLIIVGTGRNRKSLSRYLKNLNDPNIRLLGYVSESRLIDLYQHCFAVICPQIEDFGLAPIEAQSCGRPVIAFNKGGLTETVIDLKTGVFFDDQTVDSLICAINNFHKLNFDPQDCRAQALKFSQKQFMLNFKQQIQNIWGPNHNTTS